MYILIFTVYLQKRGLIKINIDLNSPVTKKNEYIFFSYVAKNIHKIFVPDFTYIIQYIYKNIIIFSPRFRMYSIYNKDAFCTAHLSMRNLLYTILTYITTLSTESIGRFQERRFKRRRQRSGSCSSVTERSPPSTREDERALIRHPVTLEPRKGW